MTQQYPQQPQWQPQPPKKKHRVRNVTLSIVGVIVVISVISAALGGGNKPASNTASGNTAGYTAPTSGPTATTTPAAPAAPQYTVAQQSAITSAEQYLSMGSGFSKEGLMTQLDSAAGEGFSKSLAHFALNHIKVNWFHQAALSAKGYMQTEGGFSYSGLVQQLDSAAGEGFTHAQAVYGAKSVGL